MTEWMSQWAKHTATRIIYVDTVEFERLYLSRLFSDKEIDRKYVGVCRADVEFSDSATRCGAHNPARTGHSNKAVSTPALSMHADAWDNGEKDTGGFARC